MIKSFFNQGVKLISSSSIYDNVGQLGTIAAVSVGRRTDRLYPDSKNTNKNA